MSTTKTSLEAQLLQAQENIENLSVEKEVFVQERTVMKQEIVYLQDKLAIATAEVHVCQYGIVHLHVRVSSRINNLGGSFECA